MSAKRFVVPLLLCLGVAGCAATQSFPPAARPGDTIALAVGWNKSLTRQATTITLTPSVGAPITYGPSDPRLRAVLRLYPDPVSRLVIGTETQQALSVNAASHGGKLLEQVTGQDKDWWMTVVALDLPASLPPGPAAITITGPEGPVTPQPILVEILPQIGTPASLAGSGLAPGDTADLLASLERAEHATLTFSGSVVPHAIQLEITRTAGVGKSWVVNPRGDLKNLSWSDDGTTLRIMLTPTHGQTLADLSQFKVYIAGGVTGLQVKSLKACDSRGNRLPGIVAEIQ